MIRKKRYLLAASVSMLSVSGAALFAAPAIADDSLSPDSATPADVSALVAEAVDSAGVSATAASGGSAVDVNVPKDAAEGVVVQVADGLDFTVATPIGVFTDQGMTTADGSTVYTGEDGHPDVAVTPLQGGVRISTVLWDESHATSFDYPLPEGVNAEVLPDGSVELTRALEVAGTAGEVAAVVGQVEPAWAVDADGNTVPTTYVVSNGILTQEVDTAGAAFPVVADPTWGFTSPIQVRVRWNRAETATIANGGWGASGITGVCAGAGAALGGPAGAAAFGAGCLATSGPAVYTAGVAQNSSPKRCLEGFLTYIPGVSLIIPWYGTYACR
ncbi:hypothetical protein [Microbacterium sp. MYb62]|uniref:hypothetical protein n=1 Tax=Microbacterium sp. MYb62 TaxID=1848690 RepID=UPI0011B0E1E2|nr:hypothetical protein [Microbacterium sp. MYb62]